MIISLTNQHFISQTSLRIFIILDEFSASASATQFYERSYKEFEQFKGVSVVQDHTEG